MALPKDATTTAVLTSAANLFARFGFRTVELSNVASDAKVPMAAVLATCLSKEDLLFQVVSAQVDAFLAHHQQLMTPQTPALQLLEALSTSSFEYLESRPLLQRLLVGGFAENVPAWADRFDELRLRCVATVVKALAHGVQQQVFRAELNLEVTAMVLLEIHAAGLLFQVNGPTRIARAQQRRAAALDVLLNGLRRR